jgi:GNAT superfamily N-acetyltransferase
MNQSEEHPPPLIRLAAIDEASVIAGVLREAFSEYEALYTPAAFSATTPTGEQIQQRWSEGPVWIALQDGRAVGTVAALPKGEALYIRSMGILPEGRGRGLGRLLLEQVEDYARRQSFKRMILSTTPFLLRAIRLYERFGFVRNGEGPHELFGTPLFTMEKDL